MSSKNNVNPDHYKVRGRDRQGEQMNLKSEKERFMKYRKGNERRGPGRDFMPGKSPSRSPGAAKDKAGPGSGAEPESSPGPSIETGTKVRRRTRSRTSRPTPAGAEQRRSKAEGAAQQSAGKSGVRSSAMKSANTRHFTNPVPAAAPVADAFGRSRGLAEVEEEIVDQEPGPGKPDDFLARRRRQNKSARK